MPLKVMTREETRKSISSERNKTYRCSFRSTLHLADHKVKTICLCFSVLTLVTKMYWFHRSYQNPTETNIVARSLCLMYLSGCKSPKQNSTKYQSSKPLVRHESVMRRLDIMSLSTSNKPVNTPFVRNLQGIRVKEHTSCCYLRGRISRRLKSAMPTV